jgi:branched-chain amino acid transport system permease protein
MPTGRALALAAVLIGAGALPMLLGQYRTFQLTLALVYAIAILGLNILTGYNGQVSLGHGAFYALGAYTAAILITRGGIAYYWTLPVAGVVGFGAGFLFGFPALRLQGLYLALATFALAVATPQILKSSHLAAWTGGVQGIVIPKPEPPTGLPLSADQWLYYVTLAVLVVLLIGAWNLVRGRSGRALEAIRDHPIAAAAMGIDLALYKTLTFGISAGYTSIAGALGAIVVQFVAPDSFTVFLSITLLVGLVVGGLGSIPGAIFGGLFVELVPNLAEQISKAAPWAIYGLFLIAFMYVMPYGIWGLMRGLFERWVQRRRRRSAGGGSPAAGRGSEGSSCEPRGH